MHSDTGAELTYILPMRASASAVGSDLDEYVRWLAQRAEVIIADGSPPAVFTAHHEAWSDIARHVTPDPALLTPMGKVGGVLTGVAMASHERLVIADDDVRYDEESLRAVVNALDDADVVRPQNYFTPMPWHALWDTSRALINRMFGGDWPGTLAVRRTMLRATGGYDGSAMFENLELVRTVLAAGGRERLALDLFVERRPSTTAHFWSQRVRQAYDEFARPRRLAVQLGMLPATILGAARYGWRPLALEAALLIALAETGRRRAGGTRVFPAVASLFAPAWATERAICSWLAVGSRVFLGGVHYRGTVLRHAATSMRVLNQRYAQLRHAHQREAYQRQAEQHEAGSPRSTAPHRSA